MSSKLRIMHLAPRIPFPADDGGKIAVANLIKQFDKMGAEVDFFCYQNNEISQSGLEEAELYCKPYIINHFPKNTLFGGLRSIITNKPVYLTKHFNKHSAEEVLKASSGRNYSFIHAEHTCMAPLAYYLREKLGVPAGLRLHNLEYSIWERYGQTLPSNSIKGIFIRLQAEMLKKAEFEIIKKADACFSISEIELQKTKALCPQANITLLKHGIETELWMRPQISREPFTMVLATSYNWIHNTDGLRWFIKYVLPKVRETIPEAKLKLIGKNPPDWLKDYKDKGVELIGYVEKVQPYLFSASVYIAPLFVGAGIRIKILEAMASGIPVVATNISAEGIGANDEQGLFITDSPTEQADKIIFLMKNPNEIDKLGAKASAFINEYYCLSKNTISALDEYKILINKNNINTI